MKDFAGIVKSEKTMKKFAESAAKYLRKHKFDGFDLGKFVELTVILIQKKLFLLDFEYPGTRDLCFCLI